MCCGGDGEIQKVDHIKHRIGIEIAWHHIKHGLSSIINFFEPPGVREEVERLEGDEIVMVVVVMVVAVGRGRNRGRQRSNRRRGCYCPWWQLRFVRVGSERGTCKDDGEWREKQESLQISPNLYIIFYFLFLNYDGCSVKPGEKFNSYNILRRFSITVLKCAS